MTKNNVDVALGSQLIFFIAWNFWKMDSKIKPSFICWIFLVGCFKSSSRGRTLGCWEHGRFVRSVERMEAFRAAMMRARR